MMMKNIFKISSFILLIIIFLNLSLLSVSAFDSFTASSLNPVIPLCACGSFSDRITIVNTGDVSSFYRLSIEGTASPFVSLSESLVSLNPGESKDVFSLINAPCNVAGEYSLRISIKTISGVEKVLDQIINIQKCNNLIVQNLTMPPSFSPCEPAIFSLRVGNSANYDDLYEFSGKGKLAKFMTFAPSKLFILPKSFSNIYVYANLPCDVYGEQEIAFSIASTRSGVVTDIYFNINISQDYAFTVDNGIYDSSIISEDDNLSISELKSLQYSSFDSDVYDLCVSNNNYAIPFKISNDVKIPNIYSIYFDSAKKSIFSLANTKVNVSGNGENIVELIINPKKSAVSQYNVSLGFDTAIGDLSAKKTVIVNIINCYDVDFPEGLSLHATKDNNTIYLAINNTGSNDAIFSFNLSGIPFASIEDKIVIDAGNVEYVPIILDMDNVSDSSYLGYLTLGIEDSDFILKNEISIHVGNSLFSNYVVYIIAGLLVVIFILFIIFSNKNKNNPVNKKETIKSKPVNQVKIKPIIYKNEIKARKEMRDGFIDFTGEKDESNSGGFYKLLILFSVIVFFIALLFFISGTFNLNKIVYYSENVTSFSANQEFAINLNKLFTQKGLVYGVNIADGEEVNSLLTSGWELATDNIMLKSVGDYIIVSSLNNYTGDFDLSFYGENRAGERFDSDDLLLSITDSNQVNRNYLSKCVLQSEYLLAKLRFYYLVYIFYVVAIYLLILFLFISDVFRSKKSSNLILTIAFIPLGLAIYYFNNFSIHYVLSMFIGFVIIFILGIYLYLREN